MKKIIRLTVLFNLVFSLSGIASHLKGGEINWECLGNGQYVFYLKLYRDCNGIPFGPTPSLNTTVPGLPTINLNLIADHDLTPAGCGNSCNNPSPASLEEFTFQSLPITLIGTPPSTGWVFYWGVNDCCRNSVGNIATGSSLMILRSIMYPYPPNGVANPCYDSSPRFTVSPTQFICLGYPYTYNALAFDSDHDSLSFAFDYPQDGLNANTNFINGFSVNNPMPGNPTVDSSSGAINLFPTNGSGNYALCTRADAFRCGYKIASVFREIQISLSASGCSGVLPNGNPLSSINEPPQVQPAPFINPLTGLYTSFIDTVNIGDTVNFTLSVTEFEQNAATMQYQYFWVDVLGAEMDTNSISPYTDCPLPPCAHLDSLTPQGPFTLAHQMHFTWITDCAHPFNSCGKEYTPYYFVVSVKDDGCSTPAINNKTITIVIRGLEIIKNGDTLSVNTTYTNLQWYFNGAIIPGANNATYIMTVPGDYEVTAQTQIGCTVSSVYRLSNGTVGINETDFSNSFFNLSPNPVSSILKITLPTIEREVMIKIYDSVGREVMHQKSRMNDDFVNLTVSSLADGIYNLSVTDKENSYKKKFVVMR